MAVEQALKIIEKPDQCFGVKEPTLQRHGANQQDRYCCRCLA
jgi:hypothetical protein